MEQPNLNYILGEFVALGQLLEETHTVVTKSDSIHTNENLNLFFSNLAEYIPIYYKRLRSFEEITRKRGKEPLLLELESIYRLIMESCLQGVAVDRETFLSGYFYQMGLYS